MPTATLSELAADPSADHFPAPKGRIILLSVIAFSLGITISVGLERMRHESFVGTFQAQVRVVTPRREARIAEWLVKPGAVVKIGQPLVRLSDDRLDDLVAKQQRDIAALRAELGQTEAKLAVELEWRLRDIHEDIFETKLKTANYIKQRYMTKLEGLAVQDMLKETDPVATQELENPALRPLIIPLRRNDERRTRLLLEQEAAQNTQETAATQVDLCEERVRDLEKTTGGLAEKVRSSSGIELVKARLEHAEQELKALENKRSALVVTAESVGVVGVYQKLQGDVVSANDTLVRLLDDEQPFVFTRVPAARLTDFLVGKVVMLKFPGGVKAKGKVVDLSLPISQPFDGLSLPDSQTLPIQIIPAGSLWPKLPLGAAVEVRLK
jgi:multidrug efflux pump subunit AcrA (membrane-fusion protein)